VIWALEGLGDTVVLEVAILDVKTGKEPEFEEAFGKAQAIISGMKGYKSHQLQKCVENGSRYILLVNWETLEDHTVGFRESSEYQEWRKLLHHFYEPFPVVEHYTTVFDNAL
jgi:heme-degrading monooxygenase HmoA